MKRNSTARFEATSSSPKRRSAGFRHFRTEHARHRRQFGNNCLPCRGGPLIQNHSFTNNGLDAEPRDLGRFLVTGKPGDRGKFTAPSLRNVELTAPYLHDGRFKTLEEVIKHYSAGVKRSPTLDPNLAKHPDGGVPLTNEAKQVLIALLKTLTDGRWPADYCDRVFSMAARSALAFGSPFAARPTRSAVIASIAPWTAMSWFALTPGIRWTSCSAITPPA